MKWQKQALIKSRSSLTMSVFLYGSECYMLVKEQTGRVAVVGHGKKDYKRNYRFRE